MIEYVVMSYWPVFESISGLFSYMCAYTYPLAISHCIDYRTYNKSSSYISSPTLLFFFQTV